jgi:hypothetical protein
MPKKRLGAEHSDHDLVAPLHWLDADKVMDVLRRAVSWSDLLQPLHRRSDPLAFQRLGFRDVEAQDHPERSLRRGQPVGFPVLAG